MQVSPHDVFRLMWEAMWRRGKCKFPPMIVLFDAVSHFLVWEMYIFNARCVPFDAGSHFLAW